MEADHPKQPPRHQPIGGPLQQLVEHPEFVVDRNAQGLEAAGGGMDAAAPGLGGIATGHHIGQFRRSLTWATPGAELLDLAGNPPRQPLLAIGVNQIGQIGFLEPGDQRGGRFTPLRVHSHIEGPISSETEAPLGHIQLGATHPQISHHGHHWGQARGWRGVVGEIAGHNRGPIAKGGQPLGRRQPGRGILIEADQLQTRVGLEQQSAVAAAAQGAIDQ